MRIEVVFLVFLLMHGDIARSETSELPQHLGKLTLGSPLPSALSSKMEHQHDHGIGLYDAREPIARMLWRKISPSLDYENTGATVYTYHNAVVIVEFSFWGKRYPDLVKALSSKYGKPKIEDILDDGPAAVNLRKWIWRDSNCTLYVIAVPEPPEQLKSEDRSGVPHVVIQHNKLYKPFRKALKWNYERGL
jgi:hypothetical protein